jgi:hypothetical protein
VLLLGCSAGVGQDITERRQPTNSSLQLRGASVAITPTPGLYLPLGCWVSLYSPAEHTNCIQQSTASDCNHHSSSWWPIRPPLLGTLHSQLRCAATTATRSRQCSAVAVVTVQRVIAYPALCSPMASPLSINPPMLGQLVFGAIILHWFQ